ADLIEIEHRRETRPGLHERPQPAEDPAAAGSLDGRHSLAVQGAVDAEVLDSDSHDLTPKLWRHEARRSRQGSGPAVTLPAARRCDLPRGSLSEKDTHPGAALAGGRAGPATAWIAADLQATDAS